VKANTDCSHGPHNESLNLRSQTIRILRQRHIYPKKRLGQNFIVDDLALRSMIAYADVDQSDVVLEVGAGLGFLTRLLSPRANKVVAVEIDPRLAVILRDQSSILPNVELVEGDVLTASIPHFDKVVSTPPYSISSPLLFWLLKKTFKVAVLAFQDEFARRLVAPVGSKDYSRLTVATYYRVDAELHDCIPRSSFYPAPDVDSIIVRLKPKPQPFRVKDERVFFELVQTVFTQRNKKLRNAVIPFVLKSGISKERAQAMADSLTFHDKRVRELAPEDFGALTDEILEKTRLLR